MKRIYVALALVFSCLLTVNTTAQVITIAQLKQRPIGDSIRTGEIVAGRVIASNQFRNTSYIQDATGGIAIFNPQFRGGVAVGDSVRITGGQIQEFQPTTGQVGTGLSQLSGGRFAFIVVPATSVTPPARTVSIASVNEAIEGSLIRLRNVSFRRTGAFQGETNYFVYNANGDSIQVRIDGGTEIATTNLIIPTEQFDLIGCVSQFRGTYQVIPRFASDLGQSVDRDTLNKETTLDITTWNMLWFGHIDVPGDSAGVDNKDLQFRNAFRILDTLRSDIVGFQEMANPASFTRMRDTLPNYGGALATQILQDQKMGYYWRKGIVDTISSGLAVNGGAQAWASGRFPFRLTVNTTINGTKKKIVLFNIHAKATATGSEQEDWQRRKTDAETFHTYLNDFYAKDAVVIFGDFNDGITESVVAGNPSPYGVFLNDTQNWSVLTKPLADLGITSYIGGSNRAMLDNIIVSDEMATAIHRTRVEPMNSFISSFTTVVSDHLPVTTRVFLDKVTNVASIEDEVVEGATLKVAPNPMTISGSIEFINETPGNVELYLTDVLGNRVMELYSGFMSNEIRLLPINTSLLASGMYSVVAVKNNTRTAKRISIVR
jgi:uncharacterized protein